jgi:hypothetical protein
MSMLSRGLGLALVLAALVPGGRTAHAQAAPLAFSNFSWPVGFGGDLSTGDAANTFGKFAGFDGGAGGGSNSRYNFPNGFFVGSEGGRAGLGLNGFSQTSAFGGSLYYQGMQAGYNFQNSPISVFAGFDTLNYKAVGTPFAPFDTVSGNVPGFRAQAGVEYRPTSNLSLSLGVGVVQQPSDINSLVLPGASPSLVNGRR